MDTIFPVTRYVTWRIQPQISLVSLSFLVQNANLSARDTHAVAQDGKKAVLTERKDHHENKLDVGLHLLNVLRILFPRRRVAPLPWAPANT